MPNMFQNLSFDPEYLRMQSIYGGMGNDLPEQGGITGNMPFPNFATDQNPPLPDATSAPPPPQAAESDAPYDVNARMAQMYTPGHDASDRLNSLLTGYPVEQEPSRLRRLGAALLAGGAYLGGGAPGMNNDHGDLFQSIALGKNFLDDPFNKQIANWKNQIGPATQAAQIEREQNVNERQMAYQTISAELRDQAEKHKAANDAVKANIAQQRADAYDFKARNPGMKLVIAKGGNIMAMDNQGQLHDTGIDSGTLTDADKAALTQEGKMEQIGAQGGNARDVANIRAGASETTAGMKTRQIFQQADDQGKMHTYSIDPNNPQDVKEVNMPGTGPLTKPGTGGAGSKINASQDRIALYNKAAEAFNNHPEWRPFIQLGLPGANDFTLKEPPNQNLMFGRGHNPQYDDYQSLKEYLYGSKQEKPNAPVTNTSTTPSRATGAGPLAGGGGRGNPTPNVPAGQDPNKRLQAIQALKTAGQPVTEANIAHLVAQIK